MAHEGNPILSRGLVAVQVKQTMDNEPDDVSDVRTVSLELVDFAFRNS